jgi:hypothetical protein
MQELKLPSIASAHNLKHITLSALSCLAQCIQSAHLHRTYEISRQPLEHHSPVSTLTRNLRAGQSVSYIAHIAWRPGVCRAQVIFIQPEVTRIVCSKPPVHFVFVYYLL